MSKKPIIVFEGIEGSGKSHHINKVSKYLYINKNKYYIDLKAILPEQEELLITALKNTL